MNDKRQAPEVKRFRPEPLPLPSVTEIQGGGTLMEYNGGNEPVCCLTLYFTGGEQEFSPAVPSLCAAMLQEGADGMSAEQIADILDFNGARYNPQSKDHFTGLSVWMLNDRVPEITGLLRRMLCQPDFPGKNLERNKKQAAARLSILSDRTSYIANQAVTALIKGAENPGARKLTEQEIYAVTADDLRNFHRLVFRRGGCHAFLSGMITETVRQAVIGLIESLPDGPGMNVDLTPFSPEHPELTTITHPGAMQASVVCALPAPPRSSEDYIPLRLTVMALGGYFGSRLMNNLREDKGLTYGVSAYLAGSLDGSAVYITLDCHADATDLVINEIKKEYEDLSNNPPAGKELERLRLYASTSALEALDTPEGIMSQYSTAFLVGIPEGYFDRQQEIVANLTSDQIGAMAAKYLLPDQLRTVVVK